MTMWQLNLAELKDECLNCDLLYQHTHTHTHTHTHSYKYLLISYRTLFNLWLDFGAKQVNLTLVTFLSYKNELFVLSTDGFQHTNSLFVNVGVFVTGCYKRTANLMFASDKEIHPRCIMQDILQNISHIHS